MELEFSTLDVFTDKRFAGNPLAVVQGADDLDTAAMHAIAREFNLSETVFLLKPENPAHSAKMRIFTPGTELPFAGHPTVGTAVMLAEQRVGAAAHDLDSLVVLEQKIGVVRVGVRLRKNEAAFAEFDAPRLPEDAGPVLDSQLLAAAVGLEPREVGFANHRPTHYSAGVPFTFLPVSSLAAMARAEVQASRWADAFGSARAGNIAVYCRETLSTASAFHTRVFFPGAGVVEDPATGAAAAAFAGVIHRFDGLRDGHHKRVVEQGFEMGRPSLITIGMEIAGSKLTTVRIGGSAVRVSTGKIKVK